MGGEPPTSDGHEVAPEGPEGDAGDPPEVLVTLEQGGCPICDLEFDEPAAFRTHLAEVHDLHDDDGTESEFGTYVLRPVEASEPPPAPLQEEARQRRHEAPQLDRPVGLLALVVCLLGLLAGVVILTGGDDEPTPGQAADAAVPTTGSQGDGASAGEAPDASASPTAPAEEPGAAGAPRTATGAPASATTPAPAPTPSPTSTPTTLAPASSTTAPATGFASPTASSARITSCARDKDLWQVTYTWRFSGGTMWKPLTSYTPLGDGRYQHVIAVPRREATAITTVSVTDPNGTRHGVSLRPALSSASC
jgi:hypothetical protein